MNVREWALPVYTILMQLSAGTLLLLWIVRAVFIPRLGHAAMERIVRIPLAIILLTICVAMVGSHFHLSQPLRSYLAVLNFRSSWLSREIAFTVLLFLTTACLLALHWLAKGGPRLKTLLGWLAVVFGLALVYCMSQIYLLPTQSAWNSPFTILSFYLTMLFLGCMALPAILLIDSSFSHGLLLERSDDHARLIRRVLVWATGAAVGGWLVLIAINGYQILLLRSGDQWARTSFDLLTNLYRPLLILRLALPLLGILWLGFSVFRAVRQNKTIKDLVMPVYVSCISVLVGEILGRFLFYATHIRIGV